MQGVRVPLALEFGPFPKFVEILEVLLLYAGGNEHLEAARCDRNLICYLLPKPSRTLRGLGEISRQF